ncbi:MAG: tetratricopeptide repeat protein, partial [Candidatus Promineifilaceae bacterium]
MTAIDLQLSAQAEQTIATRQTQIERELSRALRHQRGIIILVLYRSDWVREAVQTQLMQQLRAQQTTVEEVRITSRLPDLPAQVAAFARPAQTVVFGLGLRNGGEPAYRALNLQREQFVTEKWKVVLWLTEGELQQLMTTATDFWVFRHRYLEFLEMPSSPKTAKGLLNETKTPVEFIDPAEEASILVQIEQRQQLLAQLPDNDETMATRAFLWRSIAEQHYKLRAFDQAENAYQMVLQTSQAAEDHITTALGYHRLGIIKQQQRDWDAAHAFYQQALQIDIDFNDRHSQASTLHQLGRIKQQQRDWDAAHTFFRQAEQIFIDFDDSHSLEIV